MAAAVARAPEWGSRRASGRVARWSARLGLLLVGLIVPLVPLEAAIRLFGPVLPGNYSTGTFLAAHPAYGRFHVLGFDGWVKTDEFASRVTTNTLGLRGPERPYAKPAGVSRVLVLGDSFVEAAQVQEPEGVVGRLEAALTKRGARAEVLNVGVGGWGQHQQYVFLQQEGVRYEPDVVLVQLYLGNDVYDNSWLLQGKPRSVREPYFVFDDDGTFRQLDFRSRKPEDVPPVVAMLRERTLLWNVFETGVLQKLGASADDDADERQNRFNLNKMIVHATKPGERQDEAWKVTVALLRCIRELGDERGFKTALVLAPAQFQVYDDAWDTLLRDNKLKREEWAADGPNRALAARADEIGMPMLDLLPAFRAESERGGPPLYFARDMHWTRDGHALAAREVAAFVERERLLP